jgi:hypothetical protein
LQYCFFADARLHLYAVELFIFWCHSGASGSLARCCSSYSLICFFVQGLSGFSLVGKGHVIQRYKTKSPTE